MNQLHSPDEIANLSTNLMTLRLSIENLLILTPLDFAPAINSSNIFFSSGSMFIFGGSTSVRSMRALKYLLQQIQLFHRATTCCEY